MEREQDCARRAFLRNNNMAKKKSIVMKMEMEIKKLLLRLKKEGMPRTGTLRIDIRLIAYGVIKQLQARIKKLEHENKHQQKIIDDYADFFNGQDAAYGEKINLQSELARKPAGHF